MNKIVIASDENDFGKGAFDFARYLNEIRPLLLTGVFLRQINYAGEMEATGFGGMGVPVNVPAAEALDRVIIERNMHLFESLCQKHQIEYRVHEDIYDYAMPVLKKETRFADLLVISSEMFYRHMGVSSPNEYLRRSLHDAECAVVVVPEKYQFPNHTILAYDGSAASVYAIKQYSYLFPGWSSQATILVYEGDETDETIPEEKQIQELTSTRFTNYSVFTVKGGSKKHFREWLAGQEAPLLVTGAYGGSELSRYFHKSFVNEIISEHKTPVFIAHH